MRVTCDVKHRIFWSVNRFQIIFEFLKKSEFSEALKEIKVYI